jgi:hypothetical protein
MCITYLRDGFWNCQTALGTNEKMMNMPMHPHDREVAATLLTQMQIIVNHTIFEAHFCRTLNCFLCLWVSAMVVMYGFNYQSHKANECYLSVGNMNKLAITTSCLNEKFWNNVHCTACIMTIFMVATFALQKHR